MWAEIRKTLLAGLLIVAPITLTFYILYNLFRMLDGILSTGVTRFLVHQIGLRQLENTHIPGLGILAILALLLITDFIVTRIPLINRIYIAIREISEAVLSEKREVFKEAVLIEYPRKGLYSIAFFTQDTKGPIQDLLDEDVVSVFLPTTPNPTSGYLLFVPKSSILKVNMSVEDAMKLVISGGSIHLKETRGLNKFITHKKRKIKTAIKD
jgi:uncharacterized membrane protein